jgi:hypothetical protein
LFVKLTEVPLGVCQEAFPNQKFSEAIQDQGNTIKTKSKSQPKFQCFTLSNSTISPDMSWLLKAVRASDAPHEVHPVEQLRNSH